MADGGQTKKVRNASTTGSHTFVVLGSVIPASCRSQFARPKRDSNPGWGKKPRELVHCQPSLSNQRPKGPFGQFFVVGNGEASVR